MTVKERDILWDLYTITNKMGGRADYTAISPVAMMKYKEALGKVSTVISLIITGEMTNDVSVISTNWMLCQDGTSGTGTDAYPKRRSR